MIDCSGERGEQGSSAATSSMVGMTASPYADLIAQLNQVVNLTLDDNDNGRFVPFSNFISFM